MSIPIFVRIDGIGFGVHLCESIITDDGKVLMGRIDYQNAAIELSTGACRNEQIMELTLWHEIIHGIITAKGLKLEDEETVTEAISRGVYQVLADNPELLMD